MEICGAPEACWLMGSHVIELPTPRLVINAQYTLAHACEVERGM